MEALVLTENWKYRYTDFSRLVRENQQSLQNEKVWIEYQTEWWYQEIFLSSDRVLTEFTATLNGATEKTIFSIWYNSNLNHFRAAWTITRYTVSFKVSLLHETVIYLVTVYLCVSLIVQWLPNVSCNWSAELIRCYVTFYPHACVLVL